MTLTNDRLLSISIGENRQSVNWKPQVLTISELYERLSLPVRGQESMAVYLKLTKGQQANLKDIGGFVGGQLSGPRRKRTAVVGRDLLTLDMDSIPAGGADEVLRRVSAIGAGYCVYSTRKHRPEGPRLRAIIPLDRTVTPDEFEAIGRRIAGKIGMSYMDPSTFEPHRLMYWGSCCADGQWLFRYEDLPMLSADAVLAEYSDWHNQAEWEFAPGEPRPETDKNRVLEDPREKKGIIGAFCRRYSITEAMADFIPDAYIDAGEDRYTYAKGSTVGGAVVYDNDLFLYSHHATDPCSGQEVNAFDLVRLHRFGTLDDEAKDKIPVHKLPSYKAMMELAGSIPEIAQEVATERGQAILDAFRPVGTPVEGLAEFLGQIDGKYVTTSVVGALLLIFDIKLRLNEITWRVEVSGYPEEWTHANAENLLPTLLVDHLRPAGAIGANKQAICDSLDLIAETHRYNPVTQMLIGTVHDGHDRLTELYDIWGVTDPFSQKLIQKWLLQCVALACNDEVYPIGAEGVLVLQGAQGVGKTSALRALVPIPGMFKEGAKLDLREKDTIMQALSCWICELGELDRTTVRDSAGLKAFVTQGMDEYRTPYARKAVRRPRRTSLCGTVNPEDYLADDTGTRRWFTVHVDHVDLGRLFALTKEWTEQLWAQVYAMYRMFPDSFRLSPEERAVLEERNAGYLRALDFEMEIRDLLNYGLPESDWGEFTAAQVALKCKLCGAGPVSSKKVGRVLTKLANEDRRISSRRVHGVMRYLLPLIPDKNTGGISPDS